jgi:chromate transport protein ChrA
MLAGTTGTHGSARGRMTILAGVIGFVAGFLLEGIVGALLGMVGAVLACVVISDLVYGAGRREGSGGGALAFIVALAALVVIAIALFLEPVVVIIVLALIWLGISRHRRAQRKHAGLRVLR